MQRLALPQLPLEQNDLFAAYVALDHVTFNGWLQRCEAEAVALAFDCERLSPSKLGAQLSARIQ